MKFNSALRFTALISLLIQCCVTSPDHNDSMNVKIKGSVSEAYSDAAIKSLVTENPNQFRRIQRDPYGSLSAIVISTEGELCNGTYIGQRAIVTAAHCLDDRKGQRFFIGWPKYWDQSLETPLSSSFEVYPVTRVARFPEYDKLPDHQKFSDELSPGWQSIAAIDIGILLLATDPPDYVHRAQLVDQNFIPRQPEIDLDSNKTIHVKDGEKAIISFYIFPGKIRNSQGLLLIKKGIFIFLNDFSKSGICLVSPNEHQILSKGASGSGIYVGAPENPQLFAILNIASSSPVLAGCADVRYHSRWIQETINGN
jgi:hypothetical protein